MIRIICVGKIKEKYFVDALNEYKKRISKYSKLEIIEVSDEATDNEKIVLNKEKERILKYINKSDYNIVLDIDGTELSSVQLSEKINNIFTNYNSNITFIIGGSCGIDREIKNICDFRLSFSKMTFPHQLFRVILLEQIYRSFKILNNESYHK
ncbi:MAG: 23S rRNA (pseudouridine(1915)-N(3))-methyltransferase RlmH [Firmicutes bacterium]|nr:23S rRNA (pseudouridine(1915)-N(3))-methyltransferase RlmH [Bacillota bacterium]